MTKEQVIVSVIASMVGAGLIELVKPALKALWARMNRPSPLTLQGKVQLAAQVEVQEKALERLNHLSLHSKDVFLYLFQLGLAIFMLVSAALFLFVYQPRFFNAPLLFLLLIIILLVLVAFAESSRLSAKNIDATKSKVQKFIDEGRAKLNLH
jgi:hypothetical protein